MASDLPCGPPPPPDGGGWRQVWLPVWLTVAQAAAILKVNRKTVYAAVKRGNFPGVKRFGRNIRVHRDALLKFPDGQDRVPVSQAGMAD